MRDVPRKYRKLQQRAMKYTGRKAKIRLFCLECCAYDGKEVEKCTDKDCIFYNIRKTG